MFEFIGIEQNRIQNIQFIKVYSVLTNLSSNIISINLLGQSAISVCSGKVSSSLILAHREFRPGRSYLYTQRI